MASELESPDDIRVFIKEEPHKLSKLESGRLRLIMVLSLEDQMVDRIIFGGWVEDELLRVMDLPSKAGWSPLPFGFSQLNRAFPDQVLATDCSSFDWTVPEWVISTYIRVKLAQCEFDPAWHAAIVNRLRQVLGDAVIRLPGGERYQQALPGIMKSGWFLTISANSSFQFLINVLAWLRSHPRRPFPLIWTMGDDVLLEWKDSFSQEAFEQALSSTGIVVKRGSRNREFGGFHFLKDSVEPAYPAKHRFMLEHLSEDLAEVVCTSYMCLYSLAESEFASWVKHVVAGRSRVNPAQAKRWAFGGTLT